MTNHVTITIYKITGKQLFFQVPHAWCEECDLSVQLVKRVLEDFPKENIELVVKPWSNHVFEALLKGGWHTPVVMINNRIFSQGVIPDKKEFKHALENALRH